jgi:hypothetical protein
MALSRRPALTAGPTYPRTPCNGCVFCCALRVGAQADEIRVGSAMAEHTDAE